MSEKIVPCLWFDGNAEEAAEFYAANIPDSRVNTIQRSPDDYPAGKKGDVLLVDFTLAGRPFTALNGGDYFKFNEAVSFQIMVDDQAEADRMTNALSVVPEAEQCGWVKDKYGLSWQIVPRRLMELIADSNTEKARRVYNAMMGMKRIDIAGLEAAYAG